MSEDRHIIWSNFYLDYDDWKDDLEADYPDLSEQERIALMYEINGDYLDDERMNLNVQLSAPILVIGDLGLWHGGGWDIRKSQAEKSAIACMLTPIMPHGMLTVWATCAVMRSTMTAQTIISTAPTSPVCGSLR